MITITHAAILHKGQIWTGRRHFQIIRDILQTGVSKVSSDSPQGFLTSTGQFVDREEAAQIAFLSGQLQHPKKRLFSEDIIA